MSSSWQWSCGCYLYLSLKCPLVRKHFLWPWYLFFQWFHHWAGRRADCPGGQQGWATSFHNSLQSRLGRLHRIFLRQTCWLEFVSVCIGDLPKYSIPCNWREQYTRRLYHKKWSHIFCRKLEFEVFFKCLITLLYFYFDCDSRNIIFAWVVTVPAVAAIAALAMLALETFVV